MSTTLGDAFVRIRPDTSTFEAESKHRLGSAVKGVAVATGALLVAGLAGFSASSVKVEQEFGKTMNTMAAVANVPAKGIEQLSALAIKMGQDTVFSANDAAAAMLELAKNGLTPATIQAGALKSALTLAAAGGLSMESAATAMGNALNTFHLKGNQSAQVAAALAGAANASSASVESLTHGLSSVGPSAANAGLSIQETTAALAAFENAGIKGQDAGTSLKTFLQRLVPVTKSGREAMAAFGLETYSANKAMGALQELGIKPLHSDLGSVTAAIGDYVVKQGLATEGTAKQGEVTQAILHSTGLLHSAFVTGNGQFRSMADISQVLQDKLKNLTPAMRAQALTQIFGSDASRAATVLMNEGAKGIDKYTKATSNQKAAQKAAAATMKGTSGALEAMHGSIETVQLAFGQAIAPLVVFGAHMVSDIANGAVPIIQDLGDRMPAITKQLGEWASHIDAGEIFARIGEAIKNVDWAALWEGIQNSRGELGPFTDLLSVSGVVLKFAAGHIDLLAKALPYLAAGYLAVKGAQTLAHAAQVVSLPTKIAEVVVNRQLVASNRQLIASRVSGTIATEAGTVAEAEATVAKSTGLLASIRSAAATIAKTVAEKVAAAATKAYAGAQWLLNAAMSANPLALVAIAIAALVAGIVIAYQRSETFRKIVDAVWAGIQKAVSATVGWFLDTVVPFFTQTLPGAFNSSLSWVKEHWPLILAILTGPIGLAVLAIIRNKDAITGAFSAGLDWVKQHWPVILAVLTGPIGLAVLAIVRSKDRIVGAFQSGKDLVFAVWDHLWDLVSETTSTGISTVWSTIRNGFADIIDFMLGFASTFLNLADRAFGWIPGLSGKLDAAQRAFADFRDNVNAYLRGIQDRHVTVSGSFSVPTQAQIDKVTSQLGGLIPAATGGLFTGGVPGRDSIPALVMPGEFIHKTATVAREGIAKMHMLNSGQATIVPRSVPRFGDGGLVVDAVTNGQGAVVTASIANRIMTRLATLLGAGMKRALDGIVGDLGPPGGGSVIGDIAPGGGIARGLNWIRTQIGKPYAWGAAGPYGYDCSGLMSALTNVIRGASNPYFRLGATATMPWAGFQPGPGTFSVGWTTNYGGSGIGHTAGTLAGLNVESAGGVGVRVGSAARGAFDGGFAGLMHLAGFDSGGRLSAKPGVFGKGRTLGPERVLSDRQNSNFEALTAILDRITSSGSRAQRPAVIHLHDVNNKLIGTFTGLVKDEFQAEASWQRQQIAMDL